MSWDETTDKEDTSQSERIHHFLWKKRKVFLKDSGIIFGKFYEVE